MMASEPGTISAAPTPLRARAAISAPAVGAIATSAEASANSAMPATNTRATP